MSGSGFWRKGIAVALIVLMLFVAAAMLTPTAAAQNNYYAHYTYDPEREPDVGRVSLSPGGAGYSFYLIVGIDWGGESERSVNTTMGWGSCKCDTADVSHLFDFDFQPSSFILNVSNGYSQNVTVTVSAKAGASEPRYTCKVNASEVDPPNSPMGEGNGCHVYIQTTEEPPAEGCFIATAAYGTPLAEEIEVLRQFRDEYLLTNPVSSGLVSAYYKTSPPVAEFIDDHPALKPMVRAALLPAVALTTVAVNTTLAEKMAIAGGLALVSLALAMWLRRRAHGGGATAVKLF